MAGVADIRAKLTAYRRKRALVQLVRGTVLLALVLLALVLLVLVGESILWMSVGARTMLVVLLALAALGLFAWWVVRPASTYWGWGPQEDDASVARELGTLFPDIRDKLLNYLEWQRVPAAEGSLIAAAIAQRTEELRPIPFAQAVSFRPTWQLARWLLAPVLLLVLLAMVRPAWVFDSGTRLARFREPFVPPPPFELTIRNHADQLLAGTDHTITVTVGGDALPEELYLYRRAGLGGGEYYAMPLTRVDANTYRYTFQRVQEDFSYYVGNPGYGSAALRTVVRQMPSLRQFRLVVTPPAYTGVPPDTLAMNVGQFRAPVGTEVRLLVDPLFPVDSAWVEGDPAVFRPVAGQALQFAARLVAEGSFRIRLATADGLRNPDTVRYQYQVIPDRAPVVELAPQPTGFLPPQGIVTLDALVQDDYGLRRAELLWRIADGPDPGRVLAEFQAQPLALAGGAAQRVRSDVDFLGLDVRSGETIEFAVRAWDNDAVLGSKAGQSALQRLVYASTERLYDNLAEQSREVEGSLDGAIERIEQTRRELDDLERQMLNKRDISNTDRRRMEQLLQEQQRVNDQVEQARQELQQTRELSQENQLAKPETNLRLDQLQEMLQDINQQELLEMLKDLQRDQQPDRNQLQSMVAQMQRQNRDLKADLERIRELFKQWKARQKMDQLQRQVQEQALRQQELERLTEQRRKRDEATDLSKPPAAADLQPTQPEGKSTPDPKQEPAGQEPAQEPAPDPKSTEDLARAQQRLNDQTRQNERLLDELKQTGAKTLEEQAEALEEVEQRQQQIEQQQQQAAQQLRQGKRKPASQAQRQALDQLQQQAQQLSQMQAQAEMDQAQENYDNLRRLLANLLRLSFRQEELRNDLRKLDDQDPGVNPAERRQSRLADDMTMVRDSLEALAKRAQEIQQEVLAESRSIAEQMGYVRESLDERQVRQATSYQRNVMTSLNNLANMLTESLQRMQNNLRMQAQGQGQDQQQSQGQQQGQSLQDMIRQQRSLNEALQEMEQLVRQKQQAGDGQLDDATQQRLQEQAAEQEQIRQRLQEMFQKLQAEGQNPGTLGKAGQDMQETVEELQRLEFSRELRQRQQDILSRMLQYDKAMRVRERDQQRQGREAQPQSGRPSPGSYQSPEQEARQLREQLLRARGQFSPAYQQLVDEFLRRLPTEGPPPAVGSPTLP